MAQGKRTKPTNKKSTATARQATNAKHALKKKHLSANKSRIEDLREQLDRDALSVHSELRALVDPRLPPTVQLAPAATMDVSQSLSDLTTTLNNL
ncbi:hypothetical protein JR316_0001853 [Psilocybe cubensis]|uniref:Uncharacterized protein n=2 Tax=Psilocybe cubensis TaxID=181762 RepID=A0A8H7Y492_PSICU|nr:hypothetical protein JR316_0001853 [Psilocybe cubensis]KAH9484949.1 hypothetical protein JR316_0001853 [Psilocybe cubensis]